MKTAVESSRNTYIFQIKINKQNLAAKIIRINNVCNNLKCVLTQNVSIQIVLHFALNI